LSVYLFSYLFMCLFLCGTLFTTWRLIMTVADTDTMARTQEHADGFWLRKRSPFTVRRCKLTDLVAQGWLWRPFLVALSTTQCKNTRLLWNIFSHLPSFLYFTHISLLYHAVPLHAKQAPREGRDIAVPILDLGARRGGWSAPRPGRFSPRRRSGAHCTGSRLDIRAGPDEFGKSCPHRDLNPGPPSP
jgi:hypothetical protein